MCFHVFTDTVRPDGSLLGWKHHSSLQAPSRLKALRQRPSFCSAGCGMFALRLEAIASGLGELDWPRLHMCPLYRRS